MPVEKLSKLADEILELSNKLEQERDALEFFVNSVSENIDSMNGLVVVSGMGCFVDLVAMYADTCNELYKKAWNLTMEVESK